MELNISRTIKVGLRLVFRKASTAFSIPSTSLSVMDVQDVPAIGAETRPGVLSEVMLVLPSIVMCLLS